VQRVAPCICLISFIIQLSQDFDIEYCIYIKIFDIAGKEFNILSII